MNTKKDLNRIERDLIEGFEGLVADLKGDAPPPKKYTRRRLELNLHPRPYGPKTVRFTRNLLGASQSLFAQFLGVSTKTVSAWEQGSAPSQMACRFMDEIRRDPEYWRNRLRSAASSKGGVSPRRKVVSGR